MWDFPGSGIEPMAPALAGPLSHQGNLRMMGRVENFNGGRPWTSGGMGENLGRCQTAEGRTKMELEGMKTLCQVILRTAGLL